MALAWTDNILTPLVSRIKKIHIQEIRDYLDLHIKQVGSNADPQHLIAIRSGDDVLPGGRPGFMSAQMAQDLYNAITLTNGTLTNVSTVAGSGLTSKVNGSAITIDSTTATGSEKGMMSVADKTKLDTYPADYSTITAILNTKGAVDTISFTNTGITVDATDPKNIEITLPSATNSQDGILSATDKAKLNSIDWFPAGTTIDWYARDQNEFNLYFESNGRGKAGSKFAKWHIANGNIAANGYQTPNMIDKFRFGAGIEPCGATQYTGPNGVKISGTKAHALISSEIPPHKHEIKSIRFRASIHNVPTDALGGGEGASPEDYFTENNIGGDAHNNMPPFIAVWPLIKIED